MKIIFSVAAFLFYLNLTGCYTILWTPGMDNNTIPGNTYAYDDSSYYNGNSNYSDSNYTDSSYNGGNTDNVYISVSSDYFYDPYYYGPYAKYYHHPWWLSYVKPQVNKNNHKKVIEKIGAGTGTGTGVVRNSGDGRGESGRNPGGSTLPIINNAPPAVSTSGSATPGTANTSSSGTSNTRQTTTSSSDNNNNSSSRNSSSGSVRNNDGDRNDGGRK